ncbi:hypothetical protein COO91_07100 [Nostoc flagelliforme CCNUN1]|uniref:Uncharacterized protein n=1 Tax=Nostoc flagelliforme CCNUN1 TaxID=2038116 RepID=A0A2K8T047_9NOSO|nr:hypothetical protein COO91_07100 [Nostoc flagelliforme CCNUN1]
MVSASLPVHHRGDEEEQRKQGAGGRGQGAGEAGEAGGE